MEREQKSEQWIEDRNYLRELAKGPRRSTTIYVLISHMRGKQHMKWYNKYSGGWSRTNVPTFSTVPVEIQKAYGDAVKYYFGRCYLEDMGAQAEFIQMRMRYWKNYPKIEDNQKLLDIAERILAGHVEEELAATG